MVVESGRVYLPDAGGYVRDVFFPPSYMHLIFKWRVTYCWRWNKQSVVCVTQSSWVYTLRQLEVAGLLRAVYWGTLPLSRLLRRVLILLSLLSAGTLFSSVQIMEEGDLLVTSFSFRYLTSCCSSLIKSRCRVGKQTTAICHQAPAQFMGFGKQVARTLPLQVRAPCFLSLWLPSSSKHSSLVSNPNLTYSSSTPCSF